MSFRIRTYVVYTDEGPEIMQHHPSGRYLVVWSRIDGRTLSRIPAFRFRTVPVRACERVLLRLGFSRRLNSLGLECPINRRPQLIYRLCATREPFSIDEYLGSRFDFERSAKLEGRIHH